MMKDIEIVNEHNGIAIVCFLDLLGFSQYIRNNWDDEDVNPLEMIMKLKEELKSDEYSNGLILKMHDEGENKHSSFYCNVKTISDSVVLTFSLERTLTIAEVSFALMGLINNIMKFWGMALSMGFTIRGGIEYGKVYWNNDEIIGPAFITAYELESKFAKTSRIICGKGFNKFLLDLMNKADGMAHSIAQHFIFDEDKLCISPTLLYDNDDDKEEIIIILKELMSSLDTYKKDKYTNLINILEENSKGGIDIDNFKKLLCNH